MGNTASIDLPREKGEPIITGIRRQDSFANNSRNRTGTMAKDANGVMGLTKEFNEGAVVVNLARDPQLGFGMSFTGPLDGEERAGVFITVIKDDGPAAQSGQLFRGQQIIAVNGEDTLLATKEEVFVIIRDSQELQLEVQYDPYGFAHYDHGEELRRIRLTTFRGNNLDESPDTFDVTNLGCTNVENANTTSLQAAYAKIQSLAKANKQKQRMFVGSAVIALTPRHDAEVEHTTRLILLDVVECKSSGPLVAIVVNETHEKQQLLMCYMFTTGHKRDAGRIETLVKQRLESGLTRVQATVRKPGVKRSMTVGKDNNAMLAAAGAARNRGNPDRPVKYGWGGAIERAEDAPPSPLQAAHAVSQAVRNNNGQDRGRASTVAMGTRQTIPSTLEQQQQQQRNGSFGARTGNQAVKETPVIAGLRKFDWFQPDLRVADIERLLGKAPRGAFFVQPTQSPDTYIVYAKHSDGLKRMEICPELEHGCSVYRLAACHETFQTVPELVAHYRHNAYDTDANGKPSHLVPPVRKNTVTAGDASVADAAKNAAAAAKNARAAAAAGTNQSDESGHGSMNGHSEHMNGHAQMADHQTNGHASQTASTHNQPGGKYSSEEAATKIQAGYRGMMARRYSGELRQQRASASPPRSSDDNNTSNANDAPYTVESDAPHNDQHVKAATTIQAGYRGMKARRSTGELRAQRSANTSATSFELPPPPADDDNQFAAPPLSSDTTAAMAVDDEVDEEKRKEEELLRREMEAHMSRQDEVTRW